MGDECWHYLDSTGQEFGPFPTDTMREWFSQGFFPVGAELPVRLPAWKSSVPLRLVYPDISKAFCGPPAFTADPSAGGGPPGAAAPGPPPFSPDGGFSGYYMMPGGMMPGMMPGMAPGAGPGAGPGRGAMPGAYGGGMPGAMPGGGGASGERMVGRIKSFNAQQGFGFIECPQAHAMFGRDVFLHKAQVGDLQVGAEVTFIVEPNKQGMPQARDLLTLDGRQPGPGPAGGMQGGGGGGKGGGNRGNKGGGKGGGKRGGGKDRRNDMPGGGGGGGMGPGGGGGQGAFPMVGGPMGGPAMGAPGGGMMGGPAMGGVPAYDGGPAGGGPMPPMR